MRDLPGIYKESKHALFIFSFRCLGLFVEVVQHILMSQLSFFPSSLVVTLLACNRAVFSTDRQILTRVFTDLQLYCLHEFNRGSVLQLFAILTLAEDNSN